MQATIPVRSGIALLSFFCSIPCGYLRQRFRKYSPMWFLLIHLPIPFVALMRLEAGLDWHLIPLTLGCSLAGQLLGGVAPHRKGR